MFPQIMISLFSFESSILWYEHLRVIEPSYCIKVFEKFSKTWIGYDIFVDFTGNFERLVILMLI